LAESPAPFSIEAFTASDGYRLQYRRYADKSALQKGMPRGHLVCLHGIQSHAGWYDYSSARLSQAGFVVSFLDRRGSGMNRENRGDAPSFKRLLQDLAEFLEYLKGDAGETASPIFLIGISWGGKLAAAFQRYQPGHVHGIVLLCPGFCPRVRPPFRERLRIAWARISARGRLFAIPLNDPELFTATPQWLDFLRGDPLSLHRATARFLVESFRLDRYLRSAPAHVSVPVLLLLAEKDRIIDNAATRRYVQQFATSDLNIIEYAGAHHTLEFEPDPGRFVTDLIDWLEQHGPAWGKNGS